MRRRNENVSCNVVERLLIKRSFDELTEQENLILQDHLASCDRCRSYQNTLSNFRKAVQNGASRCPVPDPAIRHTLLQQVKTLKVSINKPKGNVWQWLRNALEYRIPGYQAVVGGVFILFLALALGKNSILISRGDEKLFEVYQIEAPFLETMNVMNKLELIDQQKIGRNAKEDSSLTQFIFEAM